MNRAPTLLLIACNASATDSVGVGLPATEPTTPSEPTEVSGPALYPAGARHSPLTPAVIDAIEAVASREPRSEDVFLKIGDSMTVDAAALHCFATTEVDLGAHPGLQQTLDAFDAGDAAGSSPFDRDSEAARIGQSVGWSMAGSPAPWAAELEAVSGRYALVQFGTNDLELGTTPQTAIWAFGSGMLALSDRLTQAGVVPLWTTIPSRGGDPALDDWVPVYNDVIRAVAQAAQTPLMDLHGALASLPGAGLGPDGVHLNSLDGWRACILDDAGLQYGNNVRNLLWLESLDRVLDARLSGGSDAAEILTGAGSWADPYAAPTLPFSHRGDTSSSPTSERDGYPDCDGGQDESGPESVFAFTLEQPARVRALVFDADGVDVDLHLIDSSGACVARHDQLLDLDLEPGVWTLVVDSYAVAGVAQSGDYLLVLTDAP